MFSRCGLSKLEQILRLTWPEVDSTNLLQWVNYVRCKGTFVFLLLEYRCQHPKAEFEVNIGSMRLN